MGSLPSSEGDVTAGFTLELLVEVISVVDIQVEKPLWAGMPASL